MVRIILIGKLSIGLAFNLTPKLTASTLLSSATPFAYGIGRDLGERIDGVAQISTGLPTYLSNAHLDPEAVLVSSDVKRVLLCDECGPYVYQFDRSTGEYIKFFGLPNNLATANLSSSGETGVVGNEVMYITN